MNTEELESKESVEGLKDSMTRYSDERTTIVNTTDLRETLEYVAELEGKLSKATGLLKGVPLYYGDVVAEVQYEDDPVGTVIDIKEGRGNENMYVVKLFKPLVHSSTVDYYRSEVVLFEREQ
jgi:hypothetical protein